MVDAVMRAHRGLCEMIATGQLCAGQPLPSETSLCERFQVSRSSLREAQKMLTVSGVLEARRGARMRVSALSPQDLANSLSTIIPLLPLDTFIEVLALREVLEGYCAAQSAAKMTNDQSQQLMNLAQQLQQTPPGHEAQILDSQYHELLVTGARQDLISALLRVIRKRSRDYPVYENAWGTDLKAKSDQAHLDIAKAIQQRNPFQAYFLTTQHIATTREWLAQYRPAPKLFDIDNIPEAH